MSRQMSQESDLMLCLQRRITLKSPDRICNARNAMRVEVESPAGTRKKALLHRRAGLASASVAEPRRVESWPRSNVCAICHRIAGDHHQRAAPVHDRRTLRRVAHRIAPAFRPSCLVDFLTFSGLSCVRSRDRSPKSRFRSLVPRTGFWFTTHDLFADQRAITMSTS